MKTAVCLLCLCLTLSCWNRRDGAVRHLGAAPRGDSGTGLRLDRIWPKEHEISIVGLVVDGCDRPIEGAAVIVVDPESAGCFYTARTDGSGAFAIPHLPAGVAYTLYVGVEEAWCTANTSTPLAASASGLQTLRISIPRPCCRAPRG